MEILVFFFFGFLKSTKSSKETVAKVKVSNFSAEQTVHWSIHGLDV